MDVYSTILLMAVLAAGVAVAALVIAWLSPRKDDPRFSRTAQVTGLLSVFLAVFALIAHYEMDHRTGMIFTEFLWAHPAPLVTIAIGVSSGWVAKATLNGETTTPVGNETS